MTHFSCKVNSVNEIVAKKLQNDKRRKTVLLTLTYENGVHHNIHFLRTSLSWWHSILNVKKKLFDHLWTIHKNVRWQLLENYSISNLKNVNYDDNGHWGGNDSIVLSL